MPDRDTGPTRITGDLYEDIYGTDRRSGYDDGREDERERIVAWLRERTYWAPTLILEYIDMIEKGAHEEKQ